MKVEVGRFYKTRDGEKRGPLYSSIGYHDGSRWSDGSRTYFDDGRWAGKNCIGNDLIEEWKEPKSQVVEKTITVKSVEAGVYNKFFVEESKVGSSIFIGLDCEVGCIDSVAFTASELEAAAHTFLELAKYLREKE